MTKRSRDMGEIRLARMNGDEIQLCGEIFSSQASAERWVREHGEPDVEHRLIRLGPKFIKRIVTQERVERVD